MDDPVIYIIITYFAPVIRLGSDLGKTVGLYGYDWAIFITLLLILFVIAVTYFLFRLLIMALGRDPDVNYLKYKKRWESDLPWNISGYSFKLEPQTSMLLKTLKVIAMPPTVILLSTLLMLSFSRFAIWLTTRTFFQIDVLDQTLLYLLDYLLTALIFISVIGIAVALILVLGRIVLRWFVMTPVYRKINCFLSRGRIRRGF